ncbi:NDR1/HIN1-like protein 13 [Mangifera indica]|uniref:NDR1/HIN1-like protein 13 n=1 Tax=Mangifera indica TaxID=29780 RepID=UPI001CF93D69|nr:NDR1/HIN1-like protein 13 [Mangifera indica]
MLNNEQTTGDLRSPPRRRNPPRYSSQHFRLQDPNSGNACIKCICCCYCCLFTLTFILTIVVYILYAIFKPEVPKYNIENFQVKSFNILPNLSLNAEATAFVKADNPNSRMGFEYGKESSVMVNYTDTTLCSGKLPAFTQPKDNVTKFTVALRGHTEVGSELQESLMAAKEARKIPLLVLIKAPIVVMLRSFPLKEVVASINCTLVVDNLAPDKPINIISSKYNYAISF